MPNMQTPAADAHAGFFRLPKVLFLDESYRGLSAESKLLYALMLDRMGLSIRNGWADGSGRVFIYFTLEEIEKMLGCGHGKATGLCRELEKTELIERGEKTGRAQRIYVKDFACVYGKPIPPQSEPDKTPEKVPRAGTPGAKFSTDFPQNSTNKTNSAVCTSKIGNLTAGNQRAACRKPEPSNTDVIKTDFNNTDPSIVLPFPRGMPPLPDGTDRKEAMQTIRENISYDILLQKWPDEKGRIDGIVSLLSDTLCSRRLYLHISGEDVPAADVRERLLSLDDSHIEYVFDCLSESTAPIGNVRAYLLTALYNAPLTIDSYYDAKVRRDMALKAGNRKNIWTA